MTESERCWEPLCNTAPPLTPSASKAVQSLRYGRDTTESLDPKQSSTEQYIEAETVSQWVEWHKQQPAVSSPPTQRPRPQLGLFLLSVCVQWTLCLKGPDIQNQYYRKEGFAVKTQWWKWIPPPMMAEYLHNELVKMPQLICTELWNDKYWTRETALLQKYSNGYERWDSGQSQLGGQVPWKWREQSHIQVWSKDSSGINTMLRMQMEIIVVEVDLEGAAGLHWSVHADIHGVSVKGNSHLRISSNVEILQISSVWGPPDNTWETHYVV